MSKLMKISEGVWIEKKIIIAHVGDTIYTHYGIIIISNDTDQISEQLESKH